MWGRLGLVADLVDLRLQVGDDLGGDVVTQDLGQVDALVGADVLVSRQLDALLDLLDGGVLGDEVRVLRLSDCLVGEVAALLLGHGVGGNGQGGEDEYSLHGGEGYAAEGLAVSGCLVSLNTSMPSSPRVSL